MTNDTLTGPAQGQLDAEPRIVERFFARTAFGGFGLVRKERAILFREVADSATDTNLPFWLVAFLSGAIATLGLLQGSAAVVIGAMLIAPLLGPLSGTAMAIAVGDARLFAQSGITLILVACGIIALAAVITMAMPVTPMTAEIASRTHPNLIDLLIAIASGTAAAVVTASRNSRLSASIPGVAVAVALVPPLGVAGYGLGTGLQWDIFGGAMLLFGANLAGIILSGELVYVLLGMARYSLAEAADEWHAEDRGQGLARWIDDLPILQNVDLGSLRKRILLTLAFAALVSVPLVTAFNQLVRDYQIGSVANFIEGRIETDGVAYVIDTTINTDTEIPSLDYTVLTRAPLSRDQIADLKRQADEKFGSEIELSVVQRVAASAAELARERDAARSQPIEQPQVRQPAAERMLALRDQLETATQALLLPRDAEIIEAQVIYPDRTAEARIILVIGTTSDGVQSDIAFDLVARQLAEKLDLDERAVSIFGLMVGPRRGSSTGEVLRDMVRYSALRIYLQAGDEGDVFASALQVGGIDPDRIERTSGEDAKSGELVCLSLGNSRRCRGSSTENLVATSEGGDET